MEYPLARRPPSPTGLVRSRSGSEKVSITSINTSQRFSTRSRSTYRSRNTGHDEDSIDSNNSSSIARNKTCNREISSRSDGFVRFLQRGNSPRNSPGTLTKKTKSTTGSPSAWALSPGRPLFSNMSMNPPDQSPAVGGDRGKVKGGMSGVLKFFRQKKVSPALEDEYHKFRVLHNRLLQWRFTNAKAESTMSCLRSLAEDRLFHVWLRIFNVRSVIVENKIEIQKMKQDMKLCGIIQGQMSMLNQWEKIERKNCEAVSRITRKVLALSVRLPFIEEAMTVYGPDPPKPINKILGFITSHLGPEYPWVELGYTKAQLHLTRLIGNVESIHKAMSTAMQVMGNIEATITKFLSQVEKILYLVTELTSILQHQNESLGEMEGILTSVALLFAWEKSVRVQLIQMDK